MKSYNNNSERADARAKEPHRIDFNLKTPYVYQFNFSMAGRFPFYYSNWLAKKLHLDSVGLLRAEAQRMNRNPILLINTYLKRENFFLAFYLSRATGHRFYIDELGFEYLQKELNKKREYLASFQKEPHRIDYYPTIIDRYEERYRVVDTQLLGLRLLSLKKGFGANLIESKLEAFDQVKEYTNLRPFAFTHAGFLTQDLLKQEGVSLYNLEVASAPPVPGQKKELLYYPGPYIYIYNDSRQLPHARVRGDSFDQMAPSEFGGDFITIKRNSATHFLKENQRTGRIVIRRRWINPIDRLIERPLPFNFYSHYPAGPFPPRHYFKYPEDGSASSHPAITRPFSSSSDGFMEPFMRFWQKRNQDQYFFQHGGFYKKDSGPLGIMDAFSRPIVSLSRYLISSQRESKPRLRITLNIFLMVLIRLGSYQELLHYQSPWRRKSNLLIVFLSVRASIQFLHQYWKGGKYQKYFY
jgi:hypothetical protein